MLGALAMIPKYAVRSDLAVLAPLLVLGVPLFDTGLVMVARWRAGRSVMLGSPDHFALRLRALGLSTWAVVLLAWGAGAVLAAAGFLLTRLATPWAAALLGSAALAGLVALLLLLRAPTPAGKGGA